MLLGAFGRGMGLMELRAAEQGGRDATGGGECPGGQKGSRGCGWAGEQEPGAWGDRWRGSLAEGESWTGLRFSAEKREERLQI